jgi:uncharacterized protein YndB with AHSA1/START domain
MKQAKSSSAPSAKAQMMIRRPVREVFEAFVDPKVAAKFCFTNSTARLEPGKTVRWEWASYGYSTEVTVLALVKNEKIRIEWFYTGSQTQVEFAFTPSGTDSTFVTITGSGFKGDPDKMVFDAMRSMGGFFLVLAGLKALLEHGIELNLMADYLPREVRPT